VRGCFVFFLVGVLVGSASSAQANPLADTIWEGNAEITVPKLVWKKERPKFNRVETVSTIKFQVPVQLWFWGKNDDPTNSVSVCFPQRKVGADPSRQELIMMLGEMPSWADELLRVVRLRNVGKSDTIYDWPGHAGRYELNPRTKRGRILVKNVDNDPQSTVWRLEGGITVSGNNLSQVTFVVSEPVSRPSLSSSDVRPGDENLISFQGNITGRVARLARLAYKPSDQQTEQFSRFFD